MIHIHSTEQTATASLGTQTDHMILSNTRAAFVEAFKALQTEIHATARSKGWWEQRDMLVELAEGHSPEMAEFAKATLKGSSIALKTSELSEALEGIRAGNPPDDKIPQFSSEAAEYADAIIRIMDTAEADNIPVAEALVAKMQYNDTRSYRHGGKKL